MLTDAYLKIKRKIGEKFFGGRNVMPRFHKKSTVGTI